jgi:hypothetical protein
LENIQFLKYNYLTMTMNTYVSDLLKETDTKEQGTFTYRDLEGLPSPVERYFRKVIKEGQRYIKSVHIKQAGRFRMREDSERWYALTATQHFTTNPPGFVWDAKIIMVPLITVRVIDMYKQGVGTLKAKLFNLMTLADDSDCKELNAGELMRYLSEAVWFPTALLPSRSISWHGINNNRAKAVISDKGQEVSAIFYFNDNDEITRAKTKRFRRTVDDTYELSHWTASYSEYQIRNGIMIPLEGRAEWNLPQGNIEYFKGNIVDITYY